jgi:hypothetical protein
MARHSNDSSPPESRSPQSDRIDLALLSLRDTTVSMTSPGGRLLRDTYQT